MGKIIRANETQTLKFRNTNISGLMLTAVLQHNSVNTDLAVSDLDLEKIVINAILKREGQKEIKILNGQVAPLAIASGLANYDQTIYSAQNQTPNLYLEAIAKGASTKEKWYRFISIPFGSVINLDGSDELEIQIVNNSGAFSTNCDTSSFIDAQEIKGVGYEFQTPEINVYSFQAGTTQDIINLGKGIKWAILVNLDKANTTDANKLVETVTIASDKVKETLSWYQILHKQLILQDRSLPTASTSYDAAAILPQGFTLLPSLEMGYDGVTLDFLLNSSNIATGKTHLVYCKSHTSEAQFIKAELKNQKHVEMNINKIYNR